MRWTWSKVDKQLLGPVPTAILFAGLGALVPIAALLLFCVRMGAVPALKRTQIAWPRLAIDLGAIAAVTAAVSFALYDGAPPLGPAGATATGLLAFCARLEVPTAPIRTQKRRALAVWAVAVATLVGLAVVGPQWWPLD